MAREPERSDMSNLRPTVEVNPSAETITALAARPDPNAIIMLNLLRFNQPDGMDAYARYGRSIVGASRTRGSRAAYTAAATDANGPWDRVTLVRYPRRAAYLDLQADPAYRGAVIHRTEALAARLLYVFHDPSGDPDREFDVAAHGDEAFVVSVIRFVDGAVPADWEPPPNVALDLEADHAMVSDGLWHRLVVARYESVDAAQAHDSRRDPMVADAIDVLTQPAPWPFSLDVSGGPAQDQKR